jgi:hypothetical protein
MSNSQTDVTLQVLLAVRDVLGGPVADGFRPDAAAASERLGRRRTEQTGGT